MRRVVLTGLVVAVVVLAFAISILRWSYADPNQAGQTKCVDFLEMTQEAREEVIEAWLPDQPKAVQQSNLVDSVAGCANDQKYHVNPNDRLEDGFP